jgi:group I intron endonuclease
MYEVYIITNVINGKRYIGITSWGLHKRWASHKRDAANGVERVLYNAMRKYGVEYFTMVKIDEVDNWVESCAKEQHYIKLYNTHFKQGCGYNMTLGGEGTPGRVLSEEHKAKIKETKSKWDDIRKKEFSDSCSKNAKLMWESFTEDDLKIRNEKISIARREHLASISSSERDELNLKIQATLRKNPSKRRECMIDGVLFISVSDASRKLNIPVATLNNRLKSSKFPNYIRGKKYVHKASDGC